MRVPVSYTRPSGLWGEAARCIVKQFALLVLRCCGHLCLVIWTLERLSLALCPLRSGSGDLNCETHWSVLFTRMSHLITQTGSILLSSKFATTENVCAHRTVSILLPTSYDFLLFSNTQSDNEIVMMTPRAGGAPHVPASSPARCEQRQSNDTPLVAVATTPSHWFVR